MTWVVVLRKREMVKRKISWRVGYFSLHRQLWWKTEETEGQGLGELGGKGRDLLAPASPFLISAERRQDQDDAIGDEGTHVYDDMEGPRPSNLVMGNYKTDRRCMKLHVKPIRSVCNCNLPPFLFRLACSEG